MKKRYVKSNEVSSHKIPKILLLCIGFLFALCYSTNVSAQGQTVRGKVTDASSQEPLVGVSVFMKGTQNGTITNADGSFSLEIPSSSATLTFSYLGYQTVDMPVNVGSFVNVVLSENTKLLEEVVVVGYGTMRKKDLTGSVVQVRPDKLAAENPKTIQDVLRGTAGMAIAYDPTAKGGGSIQIRGQRSVYTDGGHNEPLIVLDGMIFMGELSEINPDDVEQIDILKDASAAAIYGAQAANGVLIISTKKGKSGKPVINVSSNIGFTQKSAYREVWNPQEFLQHREDYQKSGTYGLNTATGVYEAYQTGTTPRGYFDNPNNLGKWGVDLNTWRNTGPGILPGAGESDLSLWARRIGLGAEGTTLQLENFLADKTFDWWNHTFRTGFSQDHNASVSGASERINYYMSFGYQHNEGAVTGNFFNNVRSNVKVEGKITNWLEIGANINFQQRSDGDIQPNLNTLNSSINSNQIRNSPYSNYLNDDGSLAYRPNGIGNFKGTNFDFQQQYMELDRGFTVLNTIFDAKVKLPLGITYLFNVQPRYRFFHDYYWESSAHPDWATGNNGLVNRENSWRFDWSLNNQITWEQTFAKVNRVNLTLVQEAERRQSWQDRIEARNFQPSDALGFHNTENSTKDNSRYYTNDTRHSADALLARLFYSYDDRYMLTASLRRDGYSAFGQSNPYATFPSIALGWTFTNEKFFNFEPLNHGKLRLTWGKNGNRALNDPYISLANLQTGGANRYGYIDNQGNLVNFHYLQISRMANPNLRWEKSEAWNAGLDLNFLKNRISSTIELYSITTRDMIMSQTLAAFAGFANMTTNLGEVSNKGVEFSITSVNIKNPNFEWSTSLNFAYDKNKIVHLYYEYEDVLDAAGNVIGTQEKNDRGNGWFIGQPISAIWDFKQTGIWQTSDYEEARTDYGQRPGDPIIQKNPDNPLQKNSNGRYEYDDNDKYFLGTRTPPINWSLRNEFILFKNLTVSLNIYSRMGHKSLSNDYLNNDNESNALIQGANHFKKEYWTTENPTNKWGRLQAQGPTGAPGAQKLFDRSFIRFENISVSYSLPKAWISRYEIERLKIFGSIRNVGVWCKDWPYGDPETYNTSTADSPYSGGLATRVFSVGLNVTF